MCILDVHASIDDRECTLAFTLKLCDHADQSNARSVRLLTKIVFNIAFSIYALKLCNHEFHVAKLHDCNIAMFIFV